MGTAVFDYNPANCTDFCMELEDWQSKALKFIEIIAYKIEQACFLPSYFVFFILSITNQISIFNDIFHKNIFIVTSNTVLNISFLFRKFLSTTHK